jgi:serine/threonine protein kinase
LSEHPAIDNPPTNELQTLHQLAIELADQQLPEGWEMVGSSVNARVAVDSRSGIYYKEFLPRGPLENIKALLKGSRATRARCRNNDLREAGFDAPENLAWGKLQGGREYLFSKAVAGKGVTSWLREDLVKRSGETLLKRRELLHALGQFIGKMHAAGFTHGDLRTSNVLADYSNDGQFRFALIDNERNILRKPPAGRALLRNLMQLNMLPPEDLSSRDRMRFFVEWRKHMGELSGEETKLIAKEAYAWAERRLKAKGKIA